MHKFVEHVRSVAIRRGNSYIPVFKRKMLSNLVSRHGPTFQLNMLVHRTKHV